MYTELRETQRYSEYVIYAFLACPGLIFHPESKYTEIFKMVMTDHLVLNVFRDTVSYLQPSLLHPPHDPRHSLSRGRH
jgi:hypothetical protein